MILSAWKNRMNVDLYYLSYYCDTKFRKLIYDDIMFNVDDENSTLDILEKILTDGIIESNLKSFNSAYKCQKIFNKYYQNISEEIYMYTSNDTPIKSIFEEFNPKDPLCFTIRNKQLAVWFCILMCVSEWIALYKESKHKNINKKEEILQ